MPPVAVIPGSTTYKSQDTVLMSLQHDTGRWGTEYTWQAESGGNILGLRVLRNFGKHGNVEPSVDEANAHNEVSTPKRVDEEEAMEGGLKGRLSAGAEIYVSTEKSAGGKWVDLSLIQQYLTSLLSICRNPVHDTARFRSCFVLKDTFLAATNNMYRNIYSHNRSPICGIRGKSF